MENFEHVLSKLKILTDAAKYDVSCSSSGHERRGKSGHIGSAAAMGVCHSWTADGRCISLLKVLYTNRCVYDCAYCINRRSAQVERASFTCRELADITMEFYRRNYIEGLFLSSAVDGSPDKTTEEMYEALRILREEYGFLGYIHAKIIPGVSAELLNKIGLVADRLSVNIEFPTREGLEQFAPQKKPEAILKPMQQITETMAEQRALVGAGNKYSHYRYKAPVLEESAKPFSFIAGQPSSDNPMQAFTSIGSELTLRQKDARDMTKKQRFSPAGQTTQLMIGATGDSDLQILNLSHSMYKKFFMRRVYFSAYIPLLEAPSLPPVGSTVPLAREHRLYQADWLMRFYGFTADEIVDKTNPNLDLELDPKVSWALRHLELFPMEINKVTPEELLRIPGIGNVSAVRILRQRKYAPLGYDDLKRIGVVLKRAKYFITVKGKYFGSSVLEQNLREHLLMQTGGIQLDMLSNQTKLLRE